MADGVAQPTGVRILWMSPPIHPNLAPDMRTAFIDEQDSVGRLHDFERPWHERDSRNARRQTAQIHLALLHGVVFLKFQRGPWLESNIGVQSHVYQMSRHPRATATEVGMAIGQTWDLSLRGYDSERGKE